MRRTSPLLVLGLLGVFAVFPGAAFAQNRVEQQIIAEQRMQQEQIQQLKLLINTLADSVKTIVTRLDDQANANRKTIADQKLQLDAINDSIRILREKGDDTNVRISTISHELETMRTAVQNLQNSVVQAMAAQQAPPPAGDTPADPNAPAAGVNPAMVQSPKDTYAKAWADFTSGRLELAIAGFQGFLRTFPNSPDAYQAQFNIGEAYYTQGKYREAANAYREFIETYKTAQWLPDAYYKRGLSYRELNMKDQAKADFQTVIQKYPDSLFASLAKQQLEGIK